MATSELRQNWFVKIKRYITVEPILIAFGIPFYLQSIAVQNFALEKSCRVNLHFNSTVCDNMIDKAKNGINCGSLNVTVKHLNETTYDLEKGNATFYIATGNLSLSLEQEVCRAEVESQKLISTINGYMAPFESILGVLTILIGGYWSDVNGRRKPLILYPIVGEFFAQVVFLIGAIFMIELPVEFVAILGSLIGSISGGVSLLYMGIFCYVTEITSEKERMFRFGLLYQIYPFMAMCTLPFSGILYQTLGYVKIILISLLLETFGILYVILILKELQVVKRENEQIDDAPSPAQFNSNLHIKEANGKEECLEKNELKKNELRFIKDKISDALRKVAIVLMRRRNGRGRLIIWLLLFCNFLYIGCEYEFVNEYFFVRTKLNWEGLEESRFAAFSSGTALFGNILMTAVFCKYFQVPDAIMGVISSTFSTFAKFFSIIASTTFMLYFARSFDMFAAMNNAANHTILSIIVSKNEIGRIFSLMGVLENFSKLIFMPIYTNVYKETVNTFPNAYFIVSFVSMATITAIFGFHIFGVWPRKHSTILYTIIAFAFHTFFTAGWTAAKSVGTAMLTDRSELILLAPTSLYASMSTLRIYIFMFNFKKMKRSFDEITEFALKNDQESEFIRKKVKRFSKTSVAYVIFMFSALGSALVAPIFEKERILPVPIWFPLDWKNNLLYYAYGYIFSTLGQLALVVLNSFVPIFIWFLMYGNALKLRLLGDRIAKLGYRTFDEKRNAGSDTEYQVEAIRSMQNFIRVHKEILKLLCFYVNDTTKYTEDSTDDLQLKSEKAANKD